MVAVAAAVPLGLGLYLTFSRGALFACLAGLVALIVLAPDWVQLRALIVSVMAAALGAVAASPFHSVATLSGALGTREREGAIALGLLAVLIVLAVVAQGLDPSPRAPAELHVPRHAGLIATAVICAGLALAIVVGAHEKSGTPLTGGAGRFGTLKSNRYDYWKVALRAFASEPSAASAPGAGRSGGCGQNDQRLRPGRPFAAAADDGGARRGRTCTARGFLGIGANGCAAPALAAGPIAAFVAYVAHAPLDWDWQMPALTLVAIVLGGALVALGETPAIRPR